MLYALLCGFPPFYSMDDEVIKRKILKGKVKYDMDIWCNISEEARDLISKMLVPEGIRLSAKQCLDHPWFMVDATKISGCSISVKTFERLKAYSKTSLFR